ncbi:hypothetical protein J6TS7_20720 [Paenibacillus dendritiformis]|uniref:hypothetical protein n=1 Tax=Paenibacillus TaxID=44249 RepID=UPI001B0F54DB|nr:hypothetical protein [Paenibacillus dendritiformis]GIO78462.1 hypothetical protein J6TS7_20720 [Paenibacillus dendritiformis]
MGRYMSTIELHTDVQEDQLILEAIHGENESEWFKKASLHYIQSAQRERPSEDTHCSIKQVVAFLESRCPQLAGLPFSEEDKISYMLRSFSKSNRSSKIDEIRSDLKTLDVLPKEGWLW